MPSARLTLPPTIQYKRSLWLDWMLSGCSSRLKYKTARSIYLIPPLLRFPVDSGIKTLPCTFGCTKKKVGAFESESIILVVRRGVLLILPVCFQQAARRPTRVTPLRIPPRPRPHHGLHMRVFFSTVITARSTPRLQYVDTQNPIKLTDRKGTQHIEPPRQ